MQTPHHAIPTLPLHLLIMSRWMSLLPGWRSVSGGSPSWNLTPKSLPASANPLEYEGLQHATLVLRGIDKYVNTPYTPPKLNRKSVWQKGSARLLDYSTKSQPNAPVIVFLPSLINRATILDLNPCRSMLRHMEAQGFHAFLLDWGAPGDAEAGFGSEAYILQRLLPAIEHLHAVHGRKVILAGHCMGGVFALAAQLLAPQKVEALALMAVPWDFHCSAFAPFLLDDSYQAVMEQMLNAQQTIPPAVIQSLFYLTDPWVFEQKYRRFAGLKAGSSEAKEFIALEHWLNDGVPMTSALAKDTLLGWAQQNQLMKREWVVNGRTIDPSQIDCPVLLALSKNDMVVPEGCALPLSGCIPHAIVHQIDAGHISMIAGKNAKNSLWPLLCDWAGRF